MIMRKSMSLLSVCAVAAAWAGPAVATGPVLKCYQMGGFRDQLRLVFDVPVKGHQSVYGKWVVPGLYSLAVSGSYETDIDGTTKHLSVVGTSNDPANFSGNLICGMNGVVGGDLSFQCTGGNSGNLQGSNSPLTSISCPPANAPIGNESGPTIGQLQRSPQ